MLRRPETVGDDIVSSRVGMMIYYYGTEDPNGALICDGRVIRYSDYPLLCVHLNTLKQTGNPRGDVSIPDCRGYFLRAYGGKSGKMDAIQSEAMLRIKGGHGAWAITADGAFYTSNRLQESIRTGATTNNTVEFDSSRVVPTADELRPNNKAYNVIIFTGELKKKNFKLFTYNFAFHINKILKYFIVRRCCKYA